MTKNALTHDDPQEPWQRTIAILALVFVFGFVILMVLLGQNLLAATAAVAAMVFAASDLSNRISNPTSRKQSSERLPDNEEQDPQDVQE
jgi:predicted membrane-bound mannosyltransferase